MGPHIPDWSVPMRVFVAGATGVLGRPTVQALVAAGHRVTGSARGEEKAALLRSLGAAPMPVDLFNHASVRFALEGSDAVIVAHVPPDLAQKLERYAVPD